MNKILAWFITFNFINFAWIFFRAKEFDDAIKVINGMAGLNNLGSIGLLFVVAGGKIEGLFLLALFIFVFFLIFFQKFTAVKYKFKVCIVCGLLFAIALFGLNKMSYFLYFNF